MTQTSLCLARFWIADEVLTGWLILAVIHHHAERAQSNADISAFASIEGGKNWPSRECELLELLSRRRSAFNYLCGSSLDGGRSRDSDLESIRPCFRFQF